MNNRTYTPTLSLKHGPALLNAITHLMVLGTFNASELLALEELRGVVERDSNDGLFSNVEKP